MPEAPAAWGERAGTDDTARPPGVRQVAVVGAGPKALSALESLGRQLRRTPPAGPVRVVVLDPGAHPGTGAAYAPDQPRHLRLNVTAAIVDAHEPDAPDRVVPSFRDWAREHAEPSAEEDFPPRAAIGGYLEAAWGEVVRRLSSSVRVEHRRARVVGMSRRRAGDDGGEQAWWVATEAEPALGPFEEVLVATGHAADHPGALRHGWESRIPLVPTVYPVSELDERAAPPGARVAVRGAALTFIDAALSLTEGRGGSFTAREDGSLAYRRVGREPATILPTARAGLFLEAKPDPGARLPPQTPEILGDGRADIGAAADMPALLGAVERAAARLLAAARGLDEQAAAGEVRTVQEGGAAPAGGAKQALERGIAAASGTGPATAAWALGRAWSQLYPAIVDRVSLAPLDEDDWAVFRAAAVRHERWAFGPPLVNARKLLALIEAGVVDTAWLEARAQIRPDGSVAGPSDPVTPGPDVVIDAVLAPPGVPALDPLLRGLADEGILCVPPGRRGCATTRDAQAVDAHGRPVPGLSVLGRPTEDVILGHDTLNRRLHPQPQLWARRVSRVLGGDL